MMRVVLVGTGTGIGKTHLGVALVAALARRGARVCGLKPIESGVPAGALGEDAAALAAVSTVALHGPPPYAFVDPVSPHLAARRQGVELSVERASLWVADHQADCLLIETAGALLSPLGPGVTNLDLARALAPDRWLLVAPDRLGVLHEVTACRIALESRLDTPIFSAPTLLTVLQTPPLPDASTGTNAAELCHLRIVDRCITMPRGEPTSPACAAAAEAILEAIEAAPDN